MFAQKGLSKEQSDLFLKKVNFMENREYFFHKRKAMTQTEEPISSFKNAEKRTEKGFYDQKMGTSCNLDDGEEPKKREYKGTKNYRGRAQAKYVPKK